MATLTVTVTHDYSAESLGPDPIDQILYTNAGSALATFGSNQFGAGAGLIANNVLLTGNGQTNQIAVLLSATVFSAASWQFGTWTSGTDRIFLNGTNGNDTIFGSSQADQFSGGLGADGLSGGTGDDIFSAGSGQIAAGEIIDGGADNDTLSLATGTHDLTLAGTTITNVERLLFNNSSAATLTASGDHFGGAGGFTSVTGDTAETQSLIVNDNSVNLSGISFTNWGGANQTITINGTNAAINLLTGSSEKDTITGTGSSADAMHGGGGADNLQGGSGDDLFDYAAAADMVAGEVISGGGGADTIQLQNVGSSDFSLATITSVETLDFVSGNSTVTFSGAQFGAGVITAVSGGTGTDALIVNAAPDVNLSGVAFTSWTDGTDTITINGTASGEILTGSSKNDIIVGGDGADFINGGDGNDILQFGTGDVDAGETINGGAGLGDVLRLTATVDFTAGTIQNIEDIAFQTTGLAVFFFLSNQFGAGLISNSLDITGDGQSNRIGVSLSAAGAFSAAGWTFSGWTSNNNFTSPADFVSLTGTSGADAITGSSEQNNIDGGNGADTLTGGAKSDSFIVRAGEVDAGESIDGAGGTDQIQILGIGANIDFSVATITTANVETLLGLDDFTATFRGDQLGTGAIVTVQGDAPNTQSLIVNGATINLSALAFTNWDGANHTITLNGTAGADSLIGSIKNDIINGGGGIDTLTGGAGDDTYVLGGGGGAITDTGGAADLVTSTISRLLTSFTGVDNLTLEGIADINATGNGSANTLTGNTGANILDGGAGIDALNGGAGNDTYVLGSENDTVTDTSGNDTITSEISRSLTSFAGIENLTLLGGALNGTGNGLANLITGNAAANTLDGAAGDDTLLASDGADTLFGGDGVDRLTGGLGRDTFTGGASADTFAFTSLEDSGKKPLTRDTIVDFTGSDFIDLSAIDAKKGGGDNAFKFIKQADFHEKKGELHFSKKSGDVLLSGDVDGNGKADFAILFADLNKLAKGDFVL